jgi:hypothetical protein
MSTRIVFIIFVVGAALMALRHEPAAKVQDRIEPIHRIEPVESFCENYYRWRETQAGGIATVDLICFNAQQMRP